MGSLAEYPNLIDNSDQQRCGCGAFLSDNECWRCGQVAKCHCGEYRPVISEHTGRDGTTYYRIKAECTGTGTAWVWE